MANILDYVAWRGDLPFSLDGPNEVDALIFSALSYIPFRGRVLKNPTAPISLKEAAADFFASPEPIGYVRPDYDLALLRAAGESRRFGSVDVCNFFTVGWQPFCLFPRYRQYIGGMERGFQYVFPPRDPIPAPCQGISAGNDDDP